MKYGFTVWGGGKEGRGGGNTTILGECNKDERESGSPTE